MVTSAAAIPPRISMPGSISTHLSIRSSSPSSRERIGAGVTCTRRRSESSGPPIRGDRKMTNEALKGLKVAIVIEDGFEQIEMVEPRKALDQAGAETRIVAPRDKHVRAWNFTN